MPNAALFGAIVLAAALAAAPAWAQSPLAQCPPIADPAARLACYDRHFAAASAWELATAPSARSSPDNVWLTVYSQQPIPLRLGGKGLASLTLRCLDGTPSAYLSFADHMMSDEGRGGAVTYTLDQLAPKTIRMWESGANDLIGLWDASRSLQFIRALFGQRNLAVRVSPFGAEPITADFTIAGLEDAIAPLRASCRW